jgi:hypothetical protein
MTGNELCAAQEYYFNDPTLVPIYEAFEADDGTYAIVTPDGYIIDPQTSPDTLMVNSNQECGMIG